MAERLQKVLANAGLGSRRKIEEWIREGRFQINGKPAQLGDRVTYKDRVKFDGRQLEPKQLTLSRRRVISYFKPEGEITTRSDPEGRPTIFRNLPKVRNGRWIAVGRLDINTSGLLLLTTDGELASRLMHPSREVEREYAVRILGEVDSDMLKRLRKGVELDDGPAKFEAIIDAGGQGANHWYHVILKEGRHREVRRLWESQGVTVSRLIRVRYGPVTLERRHLPGHCTELKDDQVQQLLDLVGLQDKPETETEPNQRKHPPRSRSRHSRNRNSGDRSSVAKTSAGKKRSTRRK
jgi:23S rRNA pseudouridine2605 synthase